MAVMMGARLLAEAMRTPSASELENGRNASRPAARHSPTYSMPMRNSFLNTPGFFSGCNHIEGSMTRSASTCLQADKVISVMLGISATNSKGPTSGV
ncbi:Uncharacterised protein [Bordetella pertussis]|nr:Uncharacterised protein [Bordetella pertussis]